MDTAAITQSSITKEYGFFEKDRRSGPFLGDADQIEESLFRLHDPCDRLLGKGDHIGRKDPHVERPDQSGDQRED